MKLVLATALACAMALPVQAEPWQDRLQKAGELAYVMGACERTVGPVLAAEVASMAKSQDPAMQLLATLYAEGRKEPTRLTVEQCSAVTTELTQELRNRENEATTKPLPVGIRAVEPRP